ncbi:uncharacterized protein LOC143186869 [Calliopsis andreniformis]|uniref:uncharacterized protein LOC143186869 n=1 Tax=Calliopsis andreniformis TaxID=337506 RepID=UPI003FCCA9AC
MNSFGDLSHISDICIPRISRLNSNQIIGRAESMPNLLEQQSCFSHSTSKNVTHPNQDYNHLQKAVKYLTLCEESIGEFAKNEIVLDCLKEVSLNKKGTLSEGVTNKLRGLLSIHELNKYMRLSLPATSLGNVQEESSVLGITDFPKYDFTHEEVLDIRCYVETLLREKIHEFVLRYENLGGNMKEVLKSTNCNMRKKLFEPYEIQLFGWKDKIEELCSQYEADILKAIALINQWNTLKYQDTNQIYLEKAEYLLLQAQVAEMQAKITKLSCIIKMFKETPITIDAHRILNAAVDEKLFVVMNEIKEKENLRSQYEKLKNTEYDEVLKTYLHFCQAIKKKKQILEKF